MGNRELTVLRGINLNIERGEMAAIMGPSGSGKTTISRTGRLWRRRRYEEVV